MTSKVKILRFIKIKNTAVEFFMYKYTDVDSVLKISLPVKLNFIFSGLYPLFKAGGANLGGGFIQAHVTLKPMFGIPSQVSSYQVFVIHGVLFQ